MQEVSTLRKGGAKDTRAQARRTAAKQRKRLNLSGFVHPGVSTAPTVGTAGCAGSRLLSVRTFSKIANLPLTIDAVETKRLQRDTSSGFERVTTEVTFHGVGHIGCGEDISLEPDRHNDYTDGRVPDLRGTWTLEAFCARTEHDDVFVDPGDPRGRPFRRWGLQAAALDLALRQAGVSMAAAIGRRPRPVTFVQSVRLGEPSSLAPLEERLAIDPDARFKLDPVPDWTDELVHQIASLGPGVVQVLDFKALYHGTPVDTEPDPDLYRRVIAAFPDAILEDPYLGECMADIVRPHMDRVAWDAPIHGVADVLALDTPPRVLNSKPCRFGSVPALMDFYDHCEPQRIALFGGGFFELGVGREQIQYLASLFHPDAPNDVSPIGYHDPHPASDVPRSPLPPPDPSVPGFRMTGEA